MRQGLLALAVAVCVFGCDRPDSPPSIRGRDPKARQPAEQATSGASRSAEQSVEYKLAVVDRGGYVAPDDISVARFRSLLDQLSSKYVENRTQIADMSVMGQKLLRDEGISESIRNLMEGLNTVLDGPLGNQQYAEYVAMYVQLRDSGREHDAAIRTLRGALRELGVQ